MAMSGTALAQAEWQQRFDAAGVDQVVWDACWGATGVPGWLDALPTFAQGESIATRVAIEKAFNASLDTVPGLVAGAADLSGKWKGDMKTPNGDMLEINFNFQVSGEKLTGTVANSYGEEQITEGTVKEDTISFVIMAGGGQFKLTYVGKVVGEEVKFHVTIGDMGEGDLTAKRVK